MVLFCKYVKIKLLAKFVPVSDCGFDRLISSRLILCRKLADNSEGNTFYYMIGALPRGALLCVCVCVGGGGGGVGGGEGVAQNIYITNILESFLLGVGVCVCV